MEDNELKEKESHASLEIGLQELVSKNVLCSVDAADFYYVKDKLKILILALVVRVMEEQFGRDNWISAIGG